MMYYVYELLDPRKNNQPFYVDHIKGAILSEETKEKIRQANVGKKHSEETRRKMSEAHKKRNSVVK